MTEVVTETMTEKVIFTASITVGRLTNIPADSQKGMLTSRIVLLQ